MHFWKCALLQSSYYHIPIFILKSFAESIQNLSFLNFWFGSIFCVVLMTLRLYCYCCFFFFDSYDLCCAKDCFQSSVPCFLSVVQTKYLKYLNYKSLSLINSLWIIINLMNLFSTFFCYLSYFLILSTSL